MITRSWIRRLFGPKPRTLRKAPARPRPALETLEERTLLSLTLNAFAPPLTGDNVIFPSAIAVGDLTGNGLPDVVSVDSANFEFGGNPNANVDVFSGQPGFSGGPSYSGAAGDGSQAFVGTDVALGDFDGRHYANGKPVLDMAVAIQDENGFLWVSILKNNGSGGNVSFGSPTVYNTWGTDVTVGDFTGNGRDDVLTTGAAGTPHLLLSNADGTFQSARDLGGDVSGRAVVGDFDGRHYANGLPILDVAEIGGNGIDVLMNNGDGTFRAPVSYGQGLTQYQLFHNAVAVGDFNADGKLDLAVADAGDNNVNVLMGNGDGTFQAAVNYAVGANPVSVGVGDFNGDGKLDIATANDVGNASSVSVLQGTGKGTFLKAQNFAAILVGDPSSVRVPPTIASSGGSNYAALAVGDFAGNGLSGVAVLSEAGYNNPVANICVMQGAGQSFFQPPVQLPGASGGVVAADFSGDGKTDVAFNPDSGRIQLFLGNGDGTFSNPIDSSPGNLNKHVVALAPGDFNANGNLGLLAVRNSFFDLYALPANGDGTFSPFLLAYSARNRDGSQAAAGDFNGDGKVDIAYQSGGGLDIFMQNSDGTFGSGGYTLTQGYFPTRTYQVGVNRSVAVDDFNGDGKVDLVVAGAGVLLGNGDGTFQSPVSYGSGGTHVAVADFDGRHYANGQPILDLVTTVANGVDVSLGNGDGTFQNPVFYRLTIPPENDGGLNSAQPLAVRDFNGDGNLDIAVGCIGGTVSVLLGNGDGTFQRPYYDQVSDSSQIAAGDFTSDGRSGIVTASGQILLPAAPDFSLSNTSVAEQQPAGTLVGTFNTATDDPNESYTYQFVGGTGGADNADFTIDAQGNLHTAASFHYATKSSYSIRVRSTDIVGQISEGVFTINVLPLAAAINVTAYNLPYDGNAHTATGTATGMGGLDLSADLTLTGTTHTNAGTYTDTWTFHDPTGAYPDQSGTVTDRIAPDPTSISVSASRAAAVYGQSVTLTATVTTPAGEAVPGSSDGMVTFFVDGTALGPPQALSGSPATAALTTAALTAGQHTITAAYTGDNNFLTSQSGVEPTTLPRTVPAPSLYLPYDVAVDDHGNLFIADTGNYRVLKVAPDGTSTAVGSGFLWPLAVAVDGQDNLFVTDYTGVLWEVPQDGTGTPTAVGSGFYQPLGVAQDGQGDVFTAEPATNQVVETKADGSQVTVGSGLSQPIGVALDAAGDVFIADTGNNRVVEVPAGLFVTVSPANAGAQVTGYSVTYDGGSHTASGSATDVNGSALPAGDFNLTATTHTTAGTYSADAWSFHDPSGNYLDASGTVSDRISPATPTLSVSDAGGTYNGNAFAASDSVAGVVAGVDSTPASTLEGVAPTLTYYQGAYATLAALNTAIAGGLTGSSTAPSVAGSYTVVASFAGSTDYSSGQALAPFTIGQATPTVSVSDASGLYNQNPFAATPTVAGVNGIAATSLEGVTPTLTYYSGSTASGTPLAGAPTLPGTYTVKASFAGSADYTSASATTTFTIQTPTTSITGPTVGVPGQPLTYTFAVNGPTQGIAFTINYGDGTRVTTSAGGPSVKLDHLYAAKGSFTIQVTAKDGNGVVSQRATQSVKVSTVAMETDPSGGKALAVGGNAAGGDTITVSATDKTGKTVDVTVNSTDYGKFTPTGHILVYGQGGRDKITLKPYVVGSTNYYIQVPAFLYGKGSGGDKISVAGSAANNVLTGHGSSEVLTGGHGRDLLIGGTGAATLNAGVGDDLLIGGWTNYDISSAGMTYDQKLAALDAVMAEWGSADSYATRLNALAGYLNTDTVHDNSQNGVPVADQLLGNALANDWFFAGLNDVVKGKNNNDVVTTIS